MKHYITTYGENGKVYVESWLQINLFGVPICFSRKKTEITARKIGRLCAMKNGIGVA